MASKEEVSAAASDLCQAPTNLSAVKPRFRWEPRKRPLREIAATIYVTMALLLFLIPQAVADRLADFTPSPLTDGARRIIAVIADVADLTGFPQFYETTRRGFLKALGRNPHPRSRS